jgi:hypothetical protein
VLLSEITISVTTYSELHALGTSSPQLATDNDLATLSTRLHDEAEHTIACSANRKTIKKFVTEGLALSDGRQTTVLNLCGVERNRVLWELEALLDERGEFSDAASLLAEDFLCVGCADDDVGDCGGDADLDAGIALLSEFTLEELVQLGVEDTVYEAGVSQLPAAIVIPFVYLMTRVFLVDQNNVLPSSLTLPLLMQYLCSVWVESYLRRTFSASSCHIY